MVFAGGIGGFSRRARERAEQEREAAELWRVFILTKDGWVTWLVRRDGFRTEHGILCVRSPEGEPLYASTFYIKGPQEVRA
jgi:hypothetical protein